MADELKITNKDGVLVGCSMALALPIPLLFAVVCLVDLVKAVSSGKRASGGMTLAAVSFLVVVGVLLYILWRVVTSVTFGERIRVRRFLGRTRAFDPEDVQVEFVDVRRKKRSLKGGLARAGWNLCIVPRDERREYRAVVSPSDMAAIRDFVQANYGSAAREREEDDAPSAGG